MISIRRAVPADAQWVFEHLRDADRREGEIFVEHPGNVYDLIERSIALSDVAYAICFHGYPVILYGVLQSPQDDPRGNVWLLATSGIATVSKWFLREARGILRELHDYYPAGLHAHVDARNATHIAWLHAVGFTLTPSPMQYGVPFLHAIRDHPSMMLPLCVSH